MDVSMKKIKELVENNVNDINNKIGFIWNEDEIRKAISLIGIDIFFFSFFFFF
jgi:hypothetical protein